MKPVTSEEISGLIDNELSADRAAEVRAAIESDPGLRKEYEMLVGLDATWRDAASGAVGQTLLSVTGGEAPDVLIRPTPPERRADDVSDRSVRPTEIIIALVILLVRFVPKFSATGIGIVIHAIALACVLWLVLKLLNAPPAPELAGTESDATSAT